MSAEDSHPRRGGIEDGHRRRVPAAHIGQTIRIENMKNLYKQDTRGPELSKKIGSHEDQRMRNPALATTVKCHRRLMKTGPQDNFHCRRIYCGNQYVSAGAGCTSDSFQIFGLSGQCSLNPAIPHYQCTKGMHTPYSVLCTLSRNPACPVPSRL